MPIPFIGHATATRLSARNAAANDYINQIDAHATLPGYVAIYNSADVELVRQNFSDPCGTVDALTGNITITPTGTQSTTVAGTPSYAVMYDGAGVAKTALHVTIGAAPVVGECVISASPILAATPITFQTITINWP